MILGIRAFLVLMFSWGLIDRVVTLFFDPSVETLTLFFISSFTATLVFLSWLSPEVFK